MHDVDENNSFIVKMINMIYIGLPQYTELFQKTRTVKNRTTSYENIDD